MEKEQASKNLPTEFQNPPIKIWLKQMTNHTQGIYCSEVGKDTISNGLE